MKAGWNLREIGEAFQTVTGNTPSKSAAHFYGQDIPLVKPPELTDGDVSSASDGLTESGAAVARVAPEGSVLVSCIGNLGKIGLATRPLAFNQQINAIYPDPSLALPRFTFYQTLSPQFREQLDALAAGTTVSIVNKSRFNSIKVHLPPLEEQERIVAVLDDAFEGLTRARAHAEANLQNARELFETSLSDALNKSATEWEVLPVGDAFTTSTGSTPPKGQKELYGDAVSFVKPPELLNQEIGETADGLSKKGGQVARIAPAGSVLVSCIGILGKVGLAITDVAFNQQINSIQPNRSKALPEFMFYQAYSSSFRRQLEALAGGTTVPIVNKSRFNSIKIALPPLDVQRNLVSRFLQIDQEAKKLQGAYRCKLQDLDDLRQSLLQKAFAGELT
ncbi:MAG: restriction endonuclease subunit S [Pelagibaca sp.]